MNSPQLDEFKTTHRYVAGGNVDTKARGDKDNFFDSYDNWTLAWAYEENSNIRPLGTAYWAGFFNTYFTIDFKNEFALIYMTQILPFNDIYSSLGRFLDILSDLCRFTQIYAELSSICKFIQHYADLLRFTQLKGEKRRLSRGWGGVR